MTPSNRHRLFLLIAAMLIGAAPVSAQITSNEGDGVLNAPYRGTIDSLRECSAGVGYGEVQSHVEPIISGLSITSASIDIWVEGAWDRSVLRMYQGLDASNSEIDLTDTSEFAPATVFTDVDGVKRLSFKAIGTKTLADQSFTIRFSYSLNGSPTTPMRVVTVAPITGSFCALPGESEAFLLGTPILGIAVGHARLTVPVGRTSEMIGAAFIEKNDNLGPTGIDTNDMLLPGAAETAHIQNFDQFRLDSSQAAKTDWGTPWPGHLIGYQIATDPFGPDGTHFDSQASPSSAFRRIDFIRPMMQSEFDPASVHYIYDNDFNNRVIEICDHPTITGCATNANVITLARTLGDVTRISTSDGRGWNIVGDSVDGRITQIAPDSGNGKRSFTYNSAGRVTQVKDAGDAVMYEFAYVNDAGGMPTVLTDERRFVDGALQTVVQHEIVSESLRRRKEFTAPGEFRQFDFAYDTAIGLNHRLASITSYEDENGAGTPFTTTFTHDVNNPDGSMVVTQVDLPDGTTINHEYDAHVGSQTVDFGFRTKSTRTGPNDGSLVTFDVDHKFFYVQSNSTRLFFRPRIVKQRDGRGAMSEVMFVYDAGGQFVDNFTDVRGQDLNRLLSITGPVINTGPSAARTPQTRFIYGEMSTTDYWLHRKEVDHASGLSRSTDYGHDALLRLASQTTDPSGLGIVTQFVFCDTAATQDRITVDPNGFWTRTRFDNDSRVTTVERFLNANAGVVGTPCVDPIGPVYRTTNTYDLNGRLELQVVENKDQDGVSLMPATITTTFMYDEIGRLLSQTVDPTGIAQVSNFDYTWLGEVEREFDTSGRGTSRLYDGRGLVLSETPLAMGEAPDTDLTTTFKYDAMGNLRLTNRPTGAVAERIYDDFDRVKQTKRIPDPGGGNNITTTFAYDNASNVTRTVADENAAVLSDTTALYDEGGFNYETRQRMADGVDGPNDPVTRRRFDWAGNVIEERSLGDATIADRVVTTEYDNAGRVDRTLDSEGGETAVVRDDRGNVTQQMVKIDAMTSAVTNMVYDALSRTVQATEPEDGANGRADRIRRYDSRGNLLRERIRDASDAPEMTTVFAYDNAGRQTRSAVLADATAATDAAVAVVTTDRVADFVYDADGRLKIRRTYNNNSAIPLDTVTTYDDLGRVDRVTDPSNSFTDDDYESNGRLSQRVVFDGVGTRAFTFGYDGHDRVTQQTALGVPNLSTTFELDGLDRQTRTTDARGIASRTDFDLVGRRTTLTENEGDPLERQTEFAYNLQSQLITQTAKNKMSSGTALADQVTTYRYDSLGRQTRVVYPDSSDHANPAGCTDCVKTVFDNAGRMTELTRQYLPPTPPPDTTFTYDKRGLLLTRTTGTDRDTFDYDAVGRMTLAKRGTTGAPDSVSGDVMAYTDLGYLDFETQAISGGTARTVDYNHDQAGNRTQLIYPASEVLAYTPTALNQVDTVTLNAAPFLDYDYAGRLLDKRRTITSDPGGSTVYEYDVGYDSHRRINAIDNRLEPNGGASQTVVSYSFSHDNNGNPLAQTATAGMAAFVADDRAFTVDRLNRLTDTEYFENGQIESTTFDLVGNRESHTNRAGTATVYDPVNAANEYPTIGGSAVTYDAAGNLAVDQDGRQYTYDERNRLIQITNPVGPVVLANYTYDALGRRIVFEDPVAGITTRYYYDGQSVIEERDAADARVRFHVNGAQFIDERVATFDDATSEFTYYIVNQNFSVAGMGNADGSVIERLDYSSTGDFAGGGGGASSFFHDAPTPDPPNPDIPPDLDLDLRDFASFQNCFDPTGMQVSQQCLDVHDFDTVDTSDGDIDLDDFARFAGCYNGPFLTPGPSCGQTSSQIVAPTSGTFTLHGRPVDILSDGHSLVPIRARYYDAANGRWLQRDPLPYNDGSNLYEPFRGNALRDTDPSGEGLLTWLLVGDYSLSDAQFLRDNTFRTVTTPVFGFVQGAGLAVGGAGREFGLVFRGKSAAQRRLVNLVEAEFEIGGATADETGVVILRATGQGIADFFGASSVATAVTGEQFIFVEEGQVFVVDLGAFERVQAGVGGVLQFSAGVSGLGHAALTRLGRLGQVGGTSALRIRVLGNIAESQAARAASRFEVFAAREQALVVSRSVATPHVVALQEFSAAALLLRANVRAGQTIFRGGNFPRSAASDAQFFSTENPLSPGFANRVGAANLGAKQPQFIMGGRVLPGGVFITRTAPAFSANRGGALEIVTEQGAVQFEFFIMP